MESRSLSPQLEFKHRSFNPIVIGLGLPSPLQFLCESMEEDGWELVNVIAHHQFENVAVFQRITEGQE